MQVTYMYGRIVYSDKDLDTYYNRYISAWDLFQKIPNREDFKIDLIVKYNSYYYQRNKLKQIVYKNNHPSLFSRFVNSIGKQLGGGSDLEYSCHFERELPHREDIIKLVKIYGERHETDETFVIDI